MLYFELYSVCSLKPRSDFILLIWKSTCVPIICWKDYLLPIGVDLASLPKVNWPQIYRYILLNWQLNSSVRVSNLMLSVNFETEIYNSLSLNLFSKFFIYRILFLFHMELEYSCLTVYNSRGTGSWENGGKDETKVS